ncbi:hypothetical protein [Nonomuraea sp. B5E05]|uniref:hypothetical protein n=1 Tax=Nonomuraea sp. B5E05 TaxID=3153569 RepID=UPI0032608F97
MHSTDRYFGNLLTEWLEVRKVRRFGWTISSFMAGCLLTGCSALPGMDGKASPTASIPGTLHASSAPTPARAVSDQEAASILADYVKRNNVANKARSDTLLASYEGGSSLTIDKADYASSRILYKTIRYRPFGYVRPVFRASAAGQRPLLLVTAQMHYKTTTEKEPTYLLFVREANGWRQMYAPDVFGGTTSKELPAIAVDASGVASEVGPTDRTSLLMSPADFAKKYAAHLAGKGTAAAKSLFATDSITTQDAVTRQRTKHFARSTSTARPATRYPSYTMRTTDGGALTFTTIERTTRYDVRPTQERGYVSHKDSGFLRGRYYTYMKVTELFQVAAHIPPKNAEPGQVKVLAAYSGVIAGSGR